MSSSLSRPRAIFYGTKDTSARQLVEAAQQLPSLIPHCFFFAPKGKLDPKLMTGSGVTARYGTEATNPLSDFGTHATVGLSQFTAAGATVLAQRLRPSDAHDAATITLSLEVVTDEWDTPLRDVNGNIVYENGTEVPQEAGAVKTTGYTMRWLVGNLEGPTWTLGARTSSVGSMTGTGGTSTVYPIADIPASSFGSDGNNLGLRLWAPTAGGADPLRTDIVSRIKGMLYRMQVIRKSTSTGKVNIVPTTGKELAVDFSFMEKAIDPSTGVSYAIEDRLVPSYDGSKLSPAYDSPFDQPYIYRDNLKAVAEMVFANEELTDSMPESVDMINLVSLRTTTGIPYYSARLVGASGGGRLLTESTDLWAAGGFDGTMSNAMLDGLVGEILSNYTTQEWEFDDMARYPHNLYVDTGFNNEVKKLLPAPGGIRPDIIAIVGTQVAGEKILTQAELKSLVSSLGTAIRQYPESALHGTGACRPFLVAGGGRKAGFGYGNMSLPLSIELGIAMLKFAGGRNWNNAKSIDDRANKTIVGWRDLGRIYMPAPTADSMWESGAVSPGWFDESTLYFTAIQTVYDDSTSILNNPYSSLAISVINRACGFAHRVLQGNSSLDNDQYKAEVDRIISEECSVERFAGKVTATPQTYYTASDEASGRSYTTDVIMKAKNMKTVGNFTIIAERL